VLGTPQRPTEVTVQTQPHISLVTAITCAVLALCVAAPAALAESPSTAPNFPSAVPSQPGALTGPDSASNAARAQERYYTSYGTSAPVTPASEPAGDGGIDWAAIGIALGATCLLTGAVIALVVRTRRRTGRVHVAA
jgi:hypothetical protein